MVRYDPKIDEEKLDLSDLRGLLKNCNGFKFSQLHLDKKYNISERIFNQVKQHSDHVFD